MNMIDIDMAGAGTCTLSPSRTTRPSTLPGSVAGTPDVSAWRERRGVFGTGVYGTAVVRGTDLRTVIDHNSIAALAAVPAEAPAKAVAKDAKQAAPPRGVPR